MKLTQFNGGKATRKAPHLILPQEGVEYFNVDNGPTSLAPINSKAASGILVSQYATYFIANAEWVSSTTLRDYAEFQNKLYWADRVGQPQKYDGTNAYQLGITAPTAALTGAVTNSPDAITRADLTEDLSAGNLPPQTLLTYLIINKDTTTGLDSDGLFLGYTTGTGATHRITITNLDTNFADEARIYRLFDGKYRLLATFTAPTDSFIDATYDISANAELSTNQGAIDGTIQYAYTYYNSADGAESKLSPLTAELEVNKGTVALSNIVASTDPQVDRKRIYRLGGQLTAFSLVDEIDNAVTTYNDTLSDTGIDGAVNDSADYDIPPVGLKYLIEANASLFGVVDNKVYFTPVGLPDAWPAENFIAYPTEVTGLGDTANGVLVFTKYVTYIITGTSPDTYASYLLSGDQGCISFDSIAQLGSALLWASTDGVCASSGNEVKVITKDKLGKIALTPIKAAVHDETYYLLQEDKNLFTLDFRYDNIAKDISGSVDYLVTANDKLYGWAAGELQEFYAGTTKESMTYLSPEITEGEYSNLKTYNEFYIRYNGDITIEIFIDGESVLTKVLTGSRPVEQLKIPQAKQQGYRVQFRITGTGEVFEITNQPMGRQK